MMAGLDKAEGAGFVNSVPHAHVAMGNCKAWLIGTHKGVWPRHLPAYLDEFVFRYNRRHNLPLAFQTLLGLGVSRGPTAYETINGAQDLPKIVYAPSYQEAGRPGRKKPVGESAPVSSGNNPSHVALPGLPDRQWDRLG